MPTEAKCTLSFPRRLPMFLSTSHRTAKVDMQSYSVSVLVGHVEKCEKLSEMQESPLPRANPSIYSKAPHSNRQFDRRKRVPAIPTDLCKEPLHESLGKRFRFITSSD
eukprot:6181638-Pleurochrysis_carterae.AAC.2